MSTLKEPVERLLQDWLLSFDAVSGQPIFIDVAHWEIHAGRMYHAEYTASVNNGAQMNLLFVTGTTADHVIFEVAVGGQSLVQMWEAPTITATGSVMLINRTIPAGNTAQTRVGGQASKGVEWIFKPETAYLLRITNNSGGAVPVSGVFEWHENTSEGY